MKKKFEQKGTFKAYHAACKWLDDNGYSYGPTCAMKPVAIYKGDCAVSKWHNLSSKDIKEMDGKMTGEMREGPVFIEIYDNNIMDKKKSNGNMYEWIDDTANPLGGECIHKCTYCYVEKLKHAKPVIKNKYTGDPEISENGMKKISGKDKFIFVCDMTDLFADNVPNSFIKEIIDKCKSKPYNKYLLQSKNTQRMFDLRYLFSDIHLQIFSVCTTFETNRYYPEFMGKSPEPMTRIREFKRLGFANIDRYITIEPIMDFDLEIVVQEIKDTMPKQVNVGGDSGNNNLPEPPKEKILELITELEKFTKVKQKSNLKRLLK